MKKIILTKLECDFLLHCLDELLKNADNSPVEKVWLEKVEKIKRHFYLEMDFFKIKYEKNNLTKKEMTEWIKTKVKNKISDL